MSGRDRLRIAVQKSGRLSEPSRDLLLRCGLSFRESRDRLFCYGEVLPIDLLLVRDDDIPGMIAQGVCDLGFVGRNVLAESRDAGAGLAEWRALGFGGCRLAIAVPQDRPYERPADLAGLRIATSYPAILGRWLGAQNVEASVVVLNGSVEIAPRLGTADAVCDLVSSGATLAANQLREVATLLESECVLAGPAEPLTGARAELAELLRRRIDAVLAVRDSRVVFLRAPRDCLAAIERLLPAGAEPMVTPLADPAEVALQALCPSALTWQHLEDMRRAGARGLYVLPVERMLA